jgi:predicted double-glycine peptidase
MSSLNRLFHLPQLFHYLQLQHLSVGMMLCLSFASAILVAHAEEETAKRHASRATATRATATRPQVSAPQGSMPKAPPNLIKVPMVRQSTDFTCGVAALQSVFAYFGDEYREDHLAKELKAVPKTGTHYQEMMRLAKAKGYSVKVLKTMTIADLKKTIDAGKPVICLIQAWADKAVDYSNDWEDGHYVVAIGHDSDNIYFMDPSTLSNYTFIPTKEFVNRWHDTDGKEKLVHFGLIIEKAKAKYNPSSFLKLD